MHQDANAFSSSSYLASLFFFLIERLRTSSREVPGARTGSRMNAAMLRTKTNLSSMDGSLSTKETGFTMLDARLSPFLISLATCNLESTLISRNRRSFRFLRTKKSSDLDPFRHFIPEIVTSCRFDVTFGMIRLTIYEGLEEHVPIKLRSGDHKSCPLFNRRSTLTTLTRLVALC